MKIRSVIVARYDEVNNGKHEVASMMGLVDTYIRYRQTSQQGDRKYHFYHPSEFGRCLRYQQYKHYAQLGYIDAKEELFESRLYRLFDKGHNMHARWAGYFEDIGILRGNWKCSNNACYMFDDNGKLIKQNHQEIINSGKTRMYGLDEKCGIFKPEKCVCGSTKFEYHEVNVKDEETNMAGHADVILDCSELDVSKYKDVGINFDVNFLPQKGQKVVGDMKTIGDSAWKNTLERKGPHKYYLIQLVIYTHILGCDYGLLMYENKNTSDMKWYKVERNEEWWKIIQWQAKYMIKMKEKKGLPPPRPLTLTSYDCKDCGFKEMCKKSKIWKDPNLDEKREKFYRSLL